jgi:hypothetical protein
MFDVAVGIRLYAAFIPTALLHLITLLQSWDEISMTKRIMSNGEICWRLEKVAGSREIAVGCDVQRDEGEV